MERKEFDTCTEIFKELFQNKVSLYGEDLKSFEKCVGPFLVPRQKELQKQLDIAVGATKLYKVQNGDDIQTTLLDGSTIMEANSNLKYEKFICRSETLEMIKLFCEQLQGKPLSADEEGALQTTIQLITQIRDLINDLPPESVLTVLLPMLSPAQCWSFYKELPSESKFIPMIVAELLNKIANNTNWLGRDEMSFADLKEFLTIYGSEVREINLSGYSSPLDTDDDVRGILELCQNLSKLNLMKCDITGEAFVGLDLPGLQEVNLSGCKLLLEPNLRSLLINAKNLCKLDLSLCNITGEAFVGLDLPGLRDISLRGCSKLTGRHLKHLLEHAANLCKLDLYNCRITGRSFVGLELPNLQEVILRSCQFLTNHNLKYLLEHAKNICKLDLAGCDITGEEFVGVVLPELKELDLSSCWHLTDPHHHLKFLLEHSKNLCKLNLLDSHNIARESFIGLLDLPGLQVVEPFAKL